MTSYVGVNTNTLASTGQQPKQVQFGDTSTLWQFALTAALAGADLIDFQTMPAGCYLTDFAIDTPSLDTGGTPAIAIDLQIKGATGTKFLRNNSIAQAGGIAIMSSTTTLPGTLGFTSTTNKTFEIGVRTGPQVGATSGTVVLKICYTVDP